MLQSLANPDNVAGMVRYGINPQNTLGVNIPALTKIAKDIGINHTMAGELWDSGIHEARILAALVEAPALVTPEQMDKWAGGFDSWDVCDQVCNKLFAKTPFAYGKAFEWCKKREEFVKRAGFVLMATLSVHDKKAPDAQFVKFLACIRESATDERNFVKKAVNWSLRQIGKRNAFLREQAIAIAGEVVSIDTKSARWIGSDALRELSGAKLRSKG